MCASFGCAHTDFAGPSQSVPIPKEKKRELFMFKVAIDLGYGDKLNLSTMDDVLNGNPVISYKRKEINLQEAVNNAKDELVRNITDGLIQLGHTILQSI